MSKEYVPLREQIKSIYKKLPSLKGLTKDEKDLIKWAVRSYENELFKDDHDCNSYDDDEES